MGVQSYLSLYTILLGWQEYDALWHIMASLGFLALPFAFLAYRAFKDPLLSMGAKDMAIVGTRRFIFNIITALFVLLFVGVPTVRLQPQVLHFKPACEQNAKTAHPGDTGTTYDRLLPVPNDIKVPLFWYVIMAFSNGITNQAIDTISCPAVNLRALQSELNLVTIQDPTLKAEINRFNKECYLPAYQKYVQLNDSQEEQQAIQMAQKKFGQDDVSWIGSEIFQTVSGFYNVLYASAPVDGFPYNPGSPNDQIQGQVGTPTTGTPACIDWWQNENYGLRKKLYAQVPDGPQKQMAIWSVSGDKTLIEDAVIRSVIEKSTGGNAFISGYDTGEDGRAGVDDFLGKWGSKIYTDALALEEYPKIHMIMNALPVIQAVLLSALIMLLAIALPLSSYSVSFCLTAAIYLFSIIFASFLWHWVTWFDQFLLQALYGANSINGHTSVWYTVRSMMIDAGSPEKNLVDFTISGFYILIPFIWLAIAGWTGSKISGFFAGVRESGQGAQRAGGQAGQHVRGLPGRIVKTLKTFK